MVAIGRTAGGIDETGRLGVARGDQHVQEAGHIDGVGRDRIDDAARHAAERGLMQDVIDAFAGVAAILERADVAFDETEPGPSRRADQRLDFVKIAPMSGGEIVQAHHGLVELEQSFQQVRADEAGDAGDQPDSGTGGEFAEKLLVGGHNRLVDHRRKSASSGRRMYFRS